MLLVRYYRFIGILLILAAAGITFGACRSQTADAPEGLVVINAPVTGKVRRVIISEGSNVQENASLIEIAVVSGVPLPAGNENRQAPAGRDPQAETRAAEDELQRAAVELQRIEPLVASGGAPQAHLDAARAQYQQVQERVDQLRRSVQNAPVDYSRQPENANVLNTVPRENIVSVPAPVAGNVRVISVRAGQTVKAGDPVATISTVR